MCRRESREHTQILHIERCQLLLMIEDVNIPLGLSPGVFRWAWHGRTPGKGQHSSEPQWGHIRSNTEGSKAICRPPVRPRSGASRRTDPGEVEEMEDEERWQGDEKRGGCGRRAWKRRAGDGCASEDRRDWREQEVAALHWRHIASQFTSLFQHSLSNNLHISSVGKLCLIYGEAKSKPVFATSISPQILWVECVSIF